MTIIRKYWRIWLRLVANSFHTQMSTSLASAGYLIGKLLRFGFFLVYLLAIFDRFPMLQGYSKIEAVLVFMTFNLIDVSAQFLFRGMYGIKALIDEGDFDKFLTQPAHVLFRISTMGVDFLDLFTLFPIIGVTVWALIEIQPPVTPSQLLLYIMLLANGIIIAYAFHVFVGALSVKTQELESAIWVYRDVMTLGRFPVNIYTDTIRMMLITAVPIGVMITFPVHALKGMLSGWGIAYAIALAAFFHASTQWYWRHTLKEYTSNSI